MKTATAVREAPAATRDFATKNGRHLMQTRSVGDYLDLLGLYDTKTRTATWDSSLGESFQRALLPIRKNPIKRRMLRDLMRGGTLPPIVLYDRGDSQRPSIVDGLQRTHVLTEALKALLAHERSEEPKEEFAREELQALKELQQNPLSVEDFLDRPVVVQVWHDLEAEELVRLFMVLNVGQQKVSARHLLEVMAGDLRRMFDEWGLKVITERQEKEQPRRRRGGDDDEPVIPGRTHFRYEYLVDGLRAYVSRDPQVKTSKILQEQTRADATNLALDERVSEIGSELCRADFRWVCTELNEAVRERYKDDPKWSIAIQNSDNFFIPLLAALGDARHHPKARIAIEDRKRKLIEIIRDNTDPDPLALTGDNSNSLAYVLGSIKSNIGRKQRGVVYGAWRRYFLLGVEDPTYPIDWRTAMLSE